MADTPISGLTSGGSAQVTDLIAVARPDGSGGYLNRKVTIPNTADATNVIATTITPNNSIMANGDNLNVVANKAQGQINAITTSKGAVNGIATLDSTGKLPLTQLTDDAVQSVNSHGGPFVSLFAVDIRTTSVPLSDTAIAPNDTGETIAGKTQGQINAINDSKGVANGIATLDSTSKLISSQLPSTVVTSVNSKSGPTVSLVPSDFVVTSVAPVNSTIVDNDSLQVVVNKAQGQINSLNGALTAVLKTPSNWDASSNTPTLVDGTGVQGTTYFVAVAGTQNLGHGSKDYNLGDLVYYGSNLQWNRLAGQSLNSLPDGNIWIGDSTSTPTPHALSGDITMDNTGDFTLQNTSNVQAIQWTNNKNQIKADTSNTLFQYTYNDGTKIATLGLKTAAALGFWCNFQNIAAAPDYYSGTVANGIIAESITDTFSNTNYSFAANPSKRIALQTGTITGGLSVTLPTAASLKKGECIIIADVSGTLGTNIISVGRSGSNTINGLATFYIKSSFVFATFMSDGVSTFTLNTDGSNLTNLSYSGMEAISPYYFLGNNTGSSLAPGPISPTSLTTMIARGTVDTVGNADYSFVTNLSKRALIHTGFIGQTRTYSLPQAGTFQPGEVINLSDITGTVGDNNYDIILSAYSGNLINGVSSITVDTGYFDLALRTDGVSNWTIGVIPNQFLAKMPARTVKVNSSTSAAAPTDVTLSQLHSLMPLGYTATFSDANYTFVLNPTIRTLIQIGTITATRTVTLPLANTLSAGEEIWIIDKSATINSSTPIILSCSGSDKINNSITAFTMNDPNNAFIRLVSDGSGNYIFNMPNSGVQPLLIITSSMSLTNQYKYIVCNNTVSIVITLPSPTGLAGKEYFIKRKNTGNVTINGSIDGASSIILGTQYMSASLVSDGSVWNII